MNLTVRSRERSFAVVELRGLSQLIIVAASRQRGASPPGGLQKAKDTMDTSTDAMGVEPVEDSLQQVVQTKPGKMDFDRSENPVAKPQPVGALNAEEVGNLIDNKLAAERDAAGLRYAGGAPGVDAIRRVFGTASSVPCNWHQATIFFLGSDDPADAAMKGHARLMLFGGLVLIAFQILTAIGVVAGVAFPSCKTSKQCGQAGTFCVPEQQRCQYCGFHGALTLLQTKEGEVNPGLVNCPWSARETIAGRYEDEEDKCLPPGNKTLVRALCSGSENWKEMLAENGHPTNAAMMGASINPGFIKAWCEACVNAVDWEADMFTTIDQCFDSVDAMGTLDWTTLVFASFVVALTVIGELKDMLLCDIAVERLGDKLGSWRHAIAIGNFLRRTLFLPGMLCIVGLLVAFRGGDSLSVCFNTVAILFLCEVSSEIYTIDRYAQSY